MTRRRQSWRAVKRAARVFMKRCLGRHDIYAVVAERPERVVWPRNSRKGTPGWRALPSWGRYL